MSDEQAYQLSLIYGTFLEPEGAADLDSLPVHEEPVDSGVILIGARLRETFERDATLDRVQLVIAGVPVGAATRDRALTGPGTAGAADTRSIGDADRASQPGDSTQYRLIAFRCRTCAAARARVFYDERRIPDCPGHGPMELQR